MNLFCPVIKENNMRIISLQNCRRADCNILTSTLSDVKEYK